MKIEENSMINSGLKLLIIMVEVIILMAMTFLTLIFQVFLMIYLAVMILFLVLEGHFLTFLISEGQALKKEKVMTL